MSINQLNLSAFRCHLEADFLFSDHINVITGDNGSGKTSVLEAVHLLSTGKSFRTPNIKKIIHHKESFLSVSARTNNGLQLGLSFNRAGEKRVRINQQNQSQIDAASQLPVVCVDPSSYLFLENSPQHRRRFFDWMMFHVKHQYMSVWQRTKKAHMNINAVLKKQNHRDFDFWLDQYVQYANTINQMRQNMFVDFKQCFGALSAHFLPGFDCEVIYHQGWKAQEQLLDVLLAEKNNAFRLGQLSHGVHRMDLKFKSAGHDAKEVLSRGQKKMVALVCYLSCLEVMDQQAEHKSVLCLDDLDSELDENNTALVLSHLKSKTNQVLITSLNDAHYDDMGSFEVFHVKH